MVKQWVVDEVNILFGNGEEVYVVEDVLGRDCIGVVLFGKIVMFGSVFFFYQMLNGFSGFIWLICINVLIG